MTSNPNIPLVGIIMGSLSDKPTIDPAMELFEQWGVPYEVIVASAHRTPDRAMRWAAEASARGLQVVIAAAGGAAHLPGVVAAHTLLPVIGLPIESGALKGVDALYAIVQMPPGIPVASMAINGSVNAAVLALEILARIEDRWLKELHAYRKGLVGKVDQQNAQLRAERPNAVWDAVSVDADAAKKKIDGGLGLSGASPPNLQLSSPSPAAPPPPKLRRVRVDAVMPDVEAIEDAVRSLLKGDIIAFPTDTVYGLAVDAQNEEAVRRLYELKERDPSRSLAILVDSPRSLPSFVKGLRSDIRSMIEAFWPGPLTVVFEAASVEMKHLSVAGTLGVRMPAHSIPLAIIQELGRPLACTSANPSGAEPAQSGRGIEEYFGDRVGMILDAGIAPTRAPSTVIDVTINPFRILREGAVDRAQLAAVLGNSLEDES